MTHILFLNMFLHVPAGIEMFYYVTFTNTHTLTQTYWRRSPVQDCANTIKFENQWKRASIEGQNK
jgi:hypothetical protein